MPLLSSTTRAELSVARWVLHADIWIPCFFLGFVTALLLPRSSSKNYLDSFWNFLALQLGYPASLSNDGTPHLQSSQLAGRMLKMDLFFNKTLSGLSSVIPYFSRQETPKKLTSQENQRQLAAKKLKKLEGGGGAFPQNAESQQTQQQQVQCSAAAAPDTAQTTTSDKSKDKKDKNKYKDKDKSKEEPPGWYTVPKRSAQPKPKKWTNGKEWPTITESVLGPTEPPKEGRKEEEPYAGHGGKPVRGSGEAL